MSDEAQLTGLSDRLLEDPLPPTRRLGVIALLIMLHGPIQFMAGRSEWHRTKQGEQLTFDLGCNGRTTRGGDLAIGA